MTGVDTQLYTVAILTLYIVIHSSINEINLNKLETIEAKKS